MVLGGFEMEMNNRATVTTLDDATSLTHSLKHRHTHTRGYRYRQTDHLPFPFPPLCSCKTPIRCSTEGREEKEEEEENSMCKLGTFFLFHPLTSICRFLSSPLSDIIIKIVLSRSAERHRPGRKQEKPKTTTPVPTLRHESPCDMQRRRWRRGRRCKLCRRKQNVRSVKKGSINVPPRLTLHKPLLPSSPSPFLARPSGTHTLQTSRPGQEPHASHAG